MMYFPVSPVAPPKMTTFDFDTIITIKQIMVSDDYELFTYLE